MRLSQNPNKSYFYQLIQSAKDICHAWGKKNGTDSYFLSDGAGYQGSGKAQKYKYTDNKMIIEMTEGHSDHGGDCFPSNGSVKVILRTSPYQTEVFYYHDENYYDSLDTYRPGEWERYLFSISERARLVIAQRKQQAEQERRAKQQAYQRFQGGHFDPINDKGFF